MKAGYIADIIVALVIIITVILCTSRGFVKSFLRHASSILSLILAMLLCKPLAGLFEKWWGWATAMDGWNVPFITGSTLLSIACAIGVFLIARLLFILLDKLLAGIRERVVVVNVVDHILGFFFGVVVAGLELATTFMVIDLLSLQTFLQLTPESGGIFAPYVFSFFKEHIFSVVDFLFGSVTQATPKM